MNKTVKIISILLVAMMVIMIGTPNVMAAKDKEEKTGASTIIGTVEDGITYTDDAGIGGIGGKIANTISIIAVVVAIIVLLVLGIKYMIGSASEKAEYKKTMIPYIVGAVLVFGAGSIVGVVVNLL